MHALDLVGARRWLFAGSAIAVVISLIILAIPPTLRPGIEFTSGTTTLIHFNQTVTQEQLREAYTELGHDEARIQSTGSNEFLIRTNELDVPPGSFTEIAPEPDVAPAGPVAAEVLGTVTLGAEGASGEVLLRNPFSGDVCSFADVAAEQVAGAIGTVMEIHEECQDGREEDTVYSVIVGDDAGLVAARNTHDFTEPPPEPVAAQDQGERTVIEEALEAEFGAFQVLEFASVSPVVSKVAVRNATVAVVVASLFIMAYIVFAFASVPSPMRYATCAVIALLHDVVIVLGAFSLLGKLFDIEVNLMFVTGLLTVIGFSVHDSIVVFDRIRENVTLAPQARLHDNVNAALLQTLARSLNTSFTLLFVVLAMLFLGGVTIRSFLLVILVGVIAGTYSSVGLAAQLLVAWDEGELGRWLRPWKRRSDEVVAPG
ncbi:MAG TPA: protein translocase subunit SecF [Dehalococcoidia bacterium]|nr:protein translocase subunit SecF [Dehalococcoidia bacterium]